jgi:hypothetical protein
MVMIAAFRTSAFHREHRVVTCRFADRLRHLQALFVLAARHADTRIADQVPADEIGIAAVIGSQNVPWIVWARTGLKNVAVFGINPGADLLLHVGQHRVLVGRREFREGTTLTAAHRHRWRQGRPRRHRGTCAADG